MPPRMYLMLDLSSFASVTIIQYKLSIQLQLPPISKLTALELLLLTHEESILTKSVMKETKKLYNSF